MPTSSLDTPRDVRFERSSSSSEYSMPVSMTPRAQSFAENTDTVPDSIRGRSITSGPVSARRALSAPTAVT